MPHIVGGCCRRRVGRHLNTQSERKQERVDMDPAILGLKCIKCGTYNNVYGRLWFMTHTVGPHMLETKMTPSTYAFDGVIVYSLQRLVRFEIGILCIS